MYPTEAKLCCPKCEGRGYIMVYADKAPSLTCVPRKKTKEIRNKLRKFNTEGKLDGLSLKNIGKLIKIESAQQVKHHLSMVDKIGWGVQE